MKNLLIASVAAAAFVLPASAADPDLVTKFSLTTGVVTVTNNGAGAADASVVTIKCQRYIPADFGGDGGCPDTPSKYLPTYTNPAFPKAWAVNVPPLAPGAVFTHTLPFFGALEFTPGWTYRFTTKADAGAVVAESNETNNVFFRERTW